jgi:PST family polysaccharide transporter
MSMVSIVERARRGGLWVAIAQFLTMLSRYGVGIVLAHLLLPSDYGLFGMASVVSGFISIIGNVGISAALTQTQDDVHRMANAAFWMNLMLATVLMGLQFLVAPLTAQFYSTPAVARIMQVLALGYVFSALGTVHNTLLTRDLRFREQTILQMLVVACSSALSIALAWFGAGAWSLVLPALLVAPLNLVLLWRIVRWLPRFSFSVTDTRKIFRFGRNVFFTDVAGYIINNLDYLLIGRLYGAQPLGIYTFAYKQAMLGCDTITGIVYQVAFPAYSAVRREGRSF